MNVVAGNTVMGDHAVIDLDPSATLSGSTASVPTFTPSSLTLSSSAGTLVLKTSASITVPGGSVNLGGAKSFPTDLADPTYDYPTLVLDQGVRVSAAGIAVSLYRNAINQVIGGVMPGGSITLGISGKPSNILLEAGSTLDVSGAQGSFYLNQTQSVAPMETSAGSFTLNGSQEMIVLGELIGKPGGASSSGGTVSLTSDRYYNNITDPTPDMAHNPTLIVVQNPSGISLPAISPNDTPTPTHIP